MIKLIFKDTSKVNPYSNHFLPSIIWICRSFSSLVRPEKKRQIQDNLGRNWFESNFYRASVFNMQTVVEFQGVAGGIQYSLIIYWIFIKEFLISWSIANLFWGLWCILAHFWPLSLWGLPTSSCTSPNYTYSGWLKKVSLIQLIPSKTTDSIVPY